MSSPQNFTLTAQPRGPVQAGADCAPRSKGRGQEPSELDRNYRIGWYIVGPFSDDEEIVEGASRFDLDTLGRRPGAYTVQASSSCAWKPARLQTGHGPGLAAERRHAGRGESGYTPIRSTRRRVRRPGPDQPPDQGLDRRGAVGRRGQPGGRRPGEPAAHQEVAGTADQVLWTIIRNRTNAIAFRRYKQFIDGVMCRGRDVRNPGARAQRSELHRHPGLPGAQAGHRRVPDAGVRHRGRRRRTTVSRRSASSTRT